MEAVILKNLSANKSFSFNYKWRPPMEAAIFEAELHFSATPPRRYPDVGHDATLELSNAVDAKNSPRLTGFIGST